MLTANEREWLEKRGKRRRYCRHCGKDRICTNINSIGTLCPTEDADFKDVAMFEAKVAAKLAEIFDASTEIAPLCPSCPCEDDCYAGHLKCKAAILKYARLAVEEEMDADGK